MSSLAFMSLQAMTVFMFLNNVNVQPLRSAAGTCPTPRHDWFSLILAKYILKSPKWNRSGPQGHTLLYRFGRFILTTLFLEDKVCGEFQLFQVHSALTEAKKQEKKGKTWKKWILLNSSCWSRYKQLAAAPHKTTFRISQIIRFSRSFILNSLNFIPSIANHRANYRQCPVAVVLFISGGCISASWDNVAVVGSQVRAITM